jgi:ketosteroid isomerase-like protein
MLGLYTDDASLYPPNLAIVTGKEAIRTYYSQLVESPGFVTSLETTKVEVSRSGDLAYSLGTSETTVNDAQGNPVTVREKWVVILKKQPDGTWKSVLDIWNSDQPAASE